MGVKQRILWVKKMYTQVAETGSSSAHNNLQPYITVCATELIEIVYGMPSYELFKAEERGEVVIGGWQE